VTIDSLDLRRLDFLKIDVLRGAPQSIQRFHPWVWVEDWTVDPEEIKGQFAGLKYRFYVVDPLNMLCAPTARLAAASGALVIDAPEA
jgi:hypothetical protein